MSNKYRSALNALSSRTGVPLPSLILSFGILHEFTAIAPLIGFFYVGKGLNVGQSVVEAVSDKEWARKWVDEGQDWAQRVGKRYGFFGYDKGDALAGDVANAVFAYGVTKALLPVRIGLSLYLSPAFSRRVLEPVRKAAIRAFRK